MEFIMKKNIYAIILFAALSSCSTIDSETNRVEVDGYPFKVVEFSGSNSFSVKPNETFSCKKTNCQFLPSDYPKAIKAVELVSGCVVNRDSVKVVMSYGATLLMTVSCKN